MNNLHWQNKRQVALLYQLHYILLSIVGGAKIDTWLQTGLVSKDTYVFFPSSAPNKHSALELCKFWGENLVAESHGPCSRCLLLKATQAL